MANWAENKERNPVVKTTDCPHCHENAGRPCRTWKGLPALVIHTSRLEAYHEPKPTPPVRSGAVMRWFMVYLGVDVVTLYD
jgi:hypothetical protein